MASRRKNAVLKKKQTWKTVAGSKSFYLSPLTENRFLLRANVDAQKPRKWKKHLVQFSVCSDTRLLPKPPGRTKPLLWHSRHSRASDMADGKSWMQTRSPLNIHALSGEVIVSRPLRRRGEVRSSLSHDLKNGLITKREIIFLIISRIIVYRRHEKDQHCSPSGRVISAFGGIKHGESRWKGLISLGFGGKLLVTGGFESKVHSDIYVTAAFPNPSASNGLFAHLLIFRRSS